MPTVLFCQSKKQELETILWTIKNHKFVEKFCNDMIYPKLPSRLWQAITRDDKTFKNSRGIVRSYLEKTNQLTLQKDAEEKLISLWKEIESDFFERIKKVLKTELSTKYICYLTKYGGGGSFNPPNTIWVRANIRNKENVKYFTYTVAHEIVHLLLEKKNQGKLQRIKEKEVDKILIKTKIFNKKSRSRFSKNGICNQRTRVTRSHQATFRKRPSNSPGDVSVRRKRPQLLHTHCRH